MPATVLFDDKVTICAHAEPDGEDLWLSPSELTEASGWELKPEGVCRDELCIVLPADRTAAMFREADGATRFNFAEFARYIGQPQAHDSKHGVWYFGPKPDERPSPQETLEAPDFALPDLSGRTHRLSDFRGRKLFLLLWASW